MAPWLELRCAEQVGGFVVSHDLALDQPWTVLFGASGSGKSTLLRLIAGLHRQRTGRLLVQSHELRSLPAWRRRIALVEQSPALFPHLSVRENVEFGYSASLAGRITPSKLLSEMGLDPLSKVMPHQLSGGERQRVAIARALASQPRALLLDEVFSGMHASLRRELMGLLRSYSSRLAMPIVSVTHDVAEVFATADEVLRMDNGSIVAQGLPGEVLDGEREDLLHQLQSKAESFVI